MKIPCIKQPCQDCPFRTDSTKGWLGKKRMTEILESDSFTCHKTNDLPARLQCAGHMLIKGENNAFVAHAIDIGDDLRLKGRELIFKTEQACIDHHAY